MYFIDSLRDNHTSYQYRIKGISPFGEQGPPSKSITGKGRQMLVFVPHIRRGYVDDKGILQVEWEFDSTGNSLISGFTLSKAATVKGEYHPVAENIAPGERSLRLDNKPGMSSYFTITAHGRDGANRTSFPVLVQVIDSMPPAIPAGLTGIIDTNGIVTLRWAPNQEPDLLGYRLFRANNRGEELSVVTGKPYLHTVYRDTVSLNTINNKLYYAVAALDRHYNQSRASAIIEIKKPDRIPPASPVITAYKVVDNSVRLDWVNSTDPDVAVHELYREGLNDTAGGWQRIARFTDTTHSYTDSKVVGGRSYMYTVSATDSSGLKSPPMPPLTVAIPADPAAKAIHTLNSYVDRERRYIEISWADDRTDIREYQLYRGAGDKPVSLWKVVPASSRKRIADEGVTINTNYEYGIRAVGRDGMIGPYKSIVVNY
jgi:fibronectin type 3 domain-containing protein